MLRSLIAALAASSAAFAALIIDPNDPRNWQGATVGTFAQLYYGSDTLANRQLVVDNKLLDDGLFDPTGFTVAKLMKTPWSTAPGAGGCRGESSDTTGTGGFDYACTNGSIFDYSDAVDTKWFQSSGSVGDTVYDLGFQATYAAVFATVDHGPLPQETIESTVYLSNDLSTWEQATVKRVWLEGYYPNTGVKWDGFVYAVSASAGTFRYASIIHGGPSALVNDGDDEINGMMGLNSGFTPTPEPSTWAMIGAGLIAFTKISRRK